MGKHAHKREKRYQKLLDKYVELEQHQARTEDAVMDAISVLFEAMEMKFVRLEDQP